MCKGKRRRSYELCVKIPGGGNVYMYICEGWREISYVFVIKCANMSLHRCVILHTYKNESLSSFLRFGN